MFIGFRRSVNQYLCINMYDFTKHQTRTQTRHINIKNSISTWCHPIAELCN